MPFPPAALHGGLHLSIFLSKDTVNSLRAWVALLCLSEASDLNKGPEDGYGLARPAGLWVTDFFFPTTPRTRSRGTATFRGGPVFAESTQRSRVDGKTPGLR